EPVRVRLQSGSVSTTLAVSNSKVPVPAPIRKAIPDQTIACSREATPLSTRGIAIKGKAPTGGTGKVRTERTPPIQRRPGGAGPANPKVSLHEAVIAVR